MQLFLLNTLTVVTSKICLLLMVAFLAIDIEASAQKKSFKQGIKGKVIWKAGNLMPSPDAPSRLVTGTPVVREVYIYELTSSKQAETDEGGVFYKNIQTKLIKKVKSDKKGNFCVGLAPGYYSVFVKEDKGLYANLFDDAMNLNPIHISQGKWEKQDLVIDHEAVY